MLFTPLSVTVGTTPELSVARTVGQVTAVKFFPLSANRLMSLGQVTPNEGLRRSAGNNRFHRKLYNEIETVTKCNHLFDKEGNNCSCNVIED